MELVTGMVKTVEVEQGALSTPEAAKFLGCSSSLLRKMRGVGEGPEYAKLNRKVVYPVQKLRDYLEKQIVC